MGVSLRTKIRKLLHNCMSLGDSLGMVVRPLAKSMGGCRRDSTVIRSPPGMVGASVVVGVASAIVQAAGAVSPTCNPIKSPSTSRSVGSRLHDPCPPSEVNR